MGLTKSPRVQRPRLEWSQRSKLSAVVTPVESVVVSDRNTRSGAARSVAFDLRDAKRLHTFLGKAIAYLSAKRKAGG